jgi:hypothetical protein
MAAQRVEIAFKGGGKDTAMEEAIKLCGRRSSFGMVTVRRLCIIIIEFAVDGALTGKATFIIMAELSRTR